MKKPDLTNVLITTPLLKNLVYRIVPQSTTAVKRKFRSNRTAKKGEVTATPPVKLKTWINGENQFTPAGVPTAQGIGGVAETLFPKPRRMATAGGPATGPERVSAEPRKARFSAQPKMRPNY
jgi:hypothetical protein